jgi:glycosyltransferase involved in cell wall biosynthesis
MACGTAVVCAGETSLPEVGGDAALYADARNPEEFGEALHKVFTDASLRGALIEKGRKNLRRFSWANTAKETLGVYEDALRISLGETRLGLSSTATSPQKSVGSN